MFLRSGAQRLFFFLQMTTYSFCVCGSVNVMFLILQAIAEVYVDHTHARKHATPNCVFVVKTTQRSYQLMAPSPEAMRIWVDVIFTGAEAYQEFD